MFRDGSGMFPAVCSMLRVLSTAVVSGTRLIIIKYASYLLICVIRENENFISVIRDPLLFQLVNRARDPPCTTLKDVFRLGES